ncbi:COG3499: Phage protein U [Escherichia coli ISC41]|nr:COG3499: Phage protein U [Escherichia coli ISC41]
MSDAINGAEDIMLGLGDFIFAISTVAYNKLQRSDAWRWAQQTRFGKKRRVADNRTTEPHNYYRWKDKRFIS